MTPLIITCVPADRSGLPQIPELDAVVVTDLYTLNSCSECGQDIWVGPRQLAVYNENDAGAILLCYECTFHLSDVAVIELGGGYGVEGRARNGHTG